MLLSICNWLINKKDDADVGSHVTQIWSQTLEESTETFISEKPTPKQISITYQHRVIIIQSQHWQLKHNSSTSGINLHLNANTKTDRTKLCNKTK